MLPLRLRGQPLTLLTFPNISNLEQRKWFA